AFSAIRHGATIELDYPITNADRTVGARLGGAIGHEFGEGEPPGRAIVRLEGEAGQSFGAFLAHGVELHLTGEANDYVGKGMGGGGYVYDPAASWPVVVNTQLVEAHRPTPEQLDRVHALIASHAELTGSRKAAEVIADPDEALRHVWRVAPKSDVAKISQKQEG